MRVAVSVGLVVYAVRAVDLAEAWRLAASLGPAAAGAGAALFVKLAAAAERWLGIVRRLGLWIPRRQGVAIVCFGNFFNQVLPSSVGGWAARVWLAHKAGYNVELAARSVVLDLLAGVVVLALMMLAGTPLLWRWFDGAGEAISVLVVSLATLVGFLILLAAGGGEARSGGRVVRALRGAARDARKIFLDRSGRFHALGFSVVFQASQVVAVWSIARGLSVDLGLLEAFVLVPAVLAAMTLPLSVGGWGVREVGLITSLGAAGVSTHAAAVIGVLFGLFNLGLGLLSGVAWLVLRGRVIAEIRARRERGVEA